MTDRDERLPEFAAGTVVGGKYRIERLVGAGGMGAVYAARHTGTGRGVAVKFLLANEPDLRRRMQREAMALGALAHPNVVGVLDVGEEGGTVFLVMELLAGKSLRDYVDGRILDPAEAIGLLMPALQGVEAAHRAGILHRDLKPDNLFVLLDDEGVPFDTKVLDFGIARPISGRGAVDITRSGAVVGTPKYMAPEQLRGSRELGPEVDVFAIGLILYELTVGRSPYDATSYESLIIEIATQIPASPKIFSPSLPDDYVALLLRCLEKRPSARFASILELARALEPFAPGVRFVVPRRAHVASLVDSEEALMPNLETTPQPVLAWSEPASSETGRPSREATSRGRPRPAAASELAETASPTIAETPSSRDVTPASLPLAKGLSPTARIALAVVVVAAAALSAVALFSSRRAPEPAPGSAAAPLPPPAPAAPAPAPSLAPPIVVPPGPSVVDATGAPVEDPDARRARTRTPPPGAVAPPATSTNVEATRPPATPPPTESASSREAHGRSGTIRTEDF